MRYELGFQARLVGVELYFDDLQHGKEFYGNNLGLDLLDEQVGHHARFNAGEIFLCLERKGAESYPSLDKAVVFLEVSDLAKAISFIGKEKFVALNPRGENIGRPWAALHDPEGYNIVLLEAPPEASIGSTANPAKP